MKTLNELKTNLRALQSEIKKLAEQTEEIKQQILDHPDVKPNLKDEGQVTIEGIEITTGYTRFWDQALLTEFKHLELFPFKTEFKEIRKGTRYLELNEPELWAQIKEALTTKPKKTAIKVKE